MATTTSTALPAGASMSISALCPTKCAPESFGLSLGALDSGDIKFFKPSLSVSVMSDEGNGTPTDSAEEEPDDDSLAQYRNLFADPRKRGCSNFNEIVERIYVGSADAVTDGSALAALSDNTRKPLIILSCASASEVPLETTLDEMGISMVRLEMEDSHEPLACMRDSLTRAAGLVHEYHTAGHSVLVVCRRGMSRSVSTVLAYLIAHEHMSLRAAIELMREKRPVSYPNLGFWKLLMDMELATSATSTVPMAALRMHKAGREYHDAPAAR